MIVTVAAADSVVHRQNASAKRRIRPGFFDDMTFIACPQIMLPLSVALLRDKMTKRHTHMSMVELKLFCPTAWRYTNRQVPPCGVGFLMRLQTGPDTALVIQLLDCLCLTAVPTLTLVHRNFFVREYQSDQSA